MAVVAGRFRLVDVVGTGAGGPVWRARDLVTGRDVAVHHARVPLEAPLVSHPHLLTTAVVAGRVIVTELARGGSVEQLLATHGALPVDYVAVLLDQLLDALTPLHDAGWLHGDVKPANLLLEATGTARPHLWLADLGSVRRLGDTGRPEGTPGYVAPEIRAGAPADPRQDLYAAGVTAAELLSGRVPRRAADLHRTTLRPVLATLIDPEPGARPRDALEARALLRQHGVPAGAPWQNRPHPPDVPDRLAEPASWRRRLLRQSR